MKRIVLTALFILLSVMAYSQSGYIHYLSEGEKFFQQGNYKDARNDFENAKGKDGKPADGNAVLDSWIQKCDEETRKLSEKIDVSSTELSFPAAGSSQTINITASGKWQVVNRPAWCRIETQSPTTLQISCEPNIVPEYRSGFVDISMGSKKKTIKITQDYQIGLSSDACVFNARGGTQTIAVKANSKDLKISSDASWVKAEMKEDSITVQCEQNSVPESRSGSVDISMGSKKKSVKITQSAGDYQIDLSADSCMFQAWGGKQMIAVKTNAKELKISSGVNWAKAEIKEDCITVQCELMVPLGERRSGQILVQAGDKEIYLPVIQEKLDRKLSFLYKYYKDTGLVPVSQNGIPKKPVNVTQSAEDYQLSLLIVGTWKLSTISYPNHTSGRYGRVLERFFTFNSNGTWTISGKNDNHSGTYSISGKTLETVNENDHGGITDYQIVSITDGKLVLNESNGMGLTFTR